MKSIDFPQSIATSATGSASTQRASQAFLAAKVQRLSSHAIFQGAQEVEIEHNGAVYRLRQTSQGKLILTK